MIASCFERIRWALPLLLVLVACSVDPAANERYHLPKCPKDKVHRGFCEESRDASVSAPTDSGAANGDGSATGSGGSGGGHPTDGGDDGGTTDDLTGKSCEGATMALYCYLGPNKTDNVGICHGGHRDCVNGKWTECLGEVQPQEEQCNGFDDDCDGEKDNDIAPKACEGCGFYECTNGHNICKKGQGALAHEICNGKDDDCDGKIDNDVEPVPCVDGNVGCTESGGVIACKGICHSGTKTCDGGKLSAACEGQVTPKSKDDCNGLNDDCDDAIDEDCSCDPNDHSSVPCYGGTPGTLDKDGNPKGECRKGTQTCDSTGKYGDCNGEQGPKAEDCTNIGHDDDCDDKIDEDIAGIDEFCPVASSECTGRNKCVGGELQCVPPPVMDEVCNKLDDNCNGYIDETFDLSTDKDNCGSCGKKCDSSTPQCCAGGCTDTTIDAKNCGECGNPCGNGIGCCHSKCMSLANDKNNCGTCGHVCAANQLCCAGACVANDVTHCGMCGVKCTAALTGCCPNGNTFTCASLGLGGLCVL